MWQGKKRRLKELSVAAEAEVSRAPALYTTERSTGLPPHTGFSERESMELKEQGFQVQMLCWINYPFWKFIRVLGLSNC